MRYKAITVLLVLAAVLWVLVLVNMEVVCDAPYGLSGPLDC